MNHNKCAYLTKWVHECPPVGGDCGGSAAAYWVHKSAGWLLSPFYLQWIKMMFGFLQGAGTTTETSADGKSQQ